MAKTRYVFNVNVHSIKEKFDLSPKANSLGWYIQLEGSGESFFISETEPELKVGDKVKITLEKVKT